MKSSKPHNGHQHIVFMQCGQIKYVANAKAQMQEQTFQRQIVPRYTFFRPVSSENLTMTKVEKQLTENKYRYLFIV